MKKKLDNSFTVLLPIFQRDDLFSNFSKVLQSIYQNTVLPSDVFLLIDGKLNNNFYRLINLQQKKYNFKILKSEKVGLANILNKGINKVSTKWIARMDGDDICEKNRFKNSLKFMNFDYDLFGGQIKEIESKSDFYFVKEVPCSSEKIIKMIKYRNPFNHMTVFYKTDFAKKIGGYPDLYLKEDYAFWIKFIYNGAKIGNMNKIVVKVKTDGMYDRRSGFKYCISEFILQKILLQSKLTNVFYSLFICPARILIHLLPRSLKKFFYISLLRKKYDSWKRSNS
jgi:cellulose synthase/poly-beta-1,6-N-acetylglucosamine synthase-like glycosyltransferase